MHLLFRTLSVILRSRIGLRRGRTLSPFDVGRLQLRTVLTDIDLLGHMNNGVYFSIFDLGRFDLMIRAGVWDTIRSMGWYTVSAAETITFRKSLDLGQRFIVESRVVGFDPKAVLIEHRAVVDGEIYARAIIRARFLRTSGGTVPIEEVAEVLGVDVNQPVPEWVLNWSADSALPNRHVSAPSTWE